MLLDSNKLATHNPELLGELDGLVDYISSIAPATREYGESLLKLADQYYGVDAHHLDETERAELEKSMRTKINLIATRSAAYARNGD
ncbi:hypothetical protein WK66_17240 [Burkholderia ubonensis]|nr:hypothetical protein WK66_17240 [Burkholderia ubonensis]